MRDLRPIFERLAEVIKKNQPVLCCGCGSTYEQGYALYIGAGTWICRGCDEAPLTGE